jgi:ribosomal protein L11 methyltransferase
VIRLAVRVRRAQADLVLAELLELAPAGVEEVGIDEETLEYALYGAPGELPSLPDLNAVAGGALVEISTSHTPDDWQERWKRFHQPVLIDAPPSSGGPPSVPAIRVRPPWEPARAQSSGEVEEIVIDPGQAFGTGGHATTRLCLELLLELAALTPGRGPLIDVGTGSGVLAIAAARLGFAPVLGLDHERESVAAARANALVNHVEIDVRHFDLRNDDLPPFDPAERPVVLANLLQPLLMELARRLSRPPEHLIAGGLLVAEVDQVVLAFRERLGVRERERRHRGEWAAVWLTP